MLSTRVWTEEQQMKANTPGRGKYKQFLQHSHSHLLMISANL